jgi:dTDP-4-dehydrorhamnose reductase
MRPEDATLPIARTVLIAAACSGNVCDKNPAATSSVNVAGTAALVSRLAEAGSRVVFLSTNQVFDGSLPFRPADDLPCPKTEYGRQKAAAERAVLNCGHRGTVLRLTKVLSPPPSLLAQWTITLAASKPIEAFNDLTCAPITLDFVADVILAIVDRGRSGIYQVSADRDFSWYEIACRLAEALGKSAEYVQPVSAGNALGEDAVPTHTTLDSTRVREEFDITPPSSAEVISVTIAGLVSQYRPAGILHRHDGYASA